MEAVLIAALISVSGGGQAQLLDPAPTPQAEAEKMGVPELLNQAKAAVENSDHEALRQSMSRLHQLRPNNSEYMYQLVLAHALLDEKSEAFNIMLKMQRQGLSYDFNQTESSENIRQPQLYKYLNDLMIEAGKPVGSAEILATLDPAVIRPEAIDWDAGRGALLLGTVNSGSIIAVAMDGSSQELFRADNINGVWGIYYLVVDPERDRLWVISASSNDFSGFDPADRGRSVLLEFKLGSMELIRHYPVPVDGLPHKLRNMALSPSGDIFITDGIFPIVYVKKADGDKLRRLAAFTDLVSLRGLDISDDGKRIYVADYEMGIEVMDIGSGTARKLAIPDTLNLGGIEGLNYWDGHLVIIQNGIKPQRVMSLELNASGLGVANVAPLAVALEVFDFPNYGTVVGEDLFFLANSHWSSHADGFKPVSIARVTLSDVPTIISPDLEKFMSEYQDAKSRGGVRSISNEQAAPPEEEESERRD
jgi:hypothetical protein